MGLPLQVVRGKGRQSYDLVMNVNLRDRILLKVSGAPQAGPGPQGTQRVLDKGEVAGSFLPCYRWGALRDKQANMMPPPPHGAQWGSSFLPKVFCKFLHF